MTPAKEAEMRAMAMVLFAHRGIPFDDTLRMSVAEIMAVWEYLNPKKLETA
jgi:hypothetical protein